MGQEFIKLIRPRSGTLPHPLALAIQLDHKFGSKWLTEKFHKLGLVESYRVTELQVGTLICKIVMKSKAKILISLKRIETW